MKRQITPTQNQRHLGANELITTKTDQKGCITYANRNFMRISGFSEPELLGVQHNIIRHPDMPRGLFKLMWNHLKQGSEFSGFFKNLCANGDYYWVFANVSPDYDKNKQLHGYYSVRSRPTQSAINIVNPIYQAMLGIEKEGSTQSGLSSSVTHLNDVVARSGARNYNSFILGLYKLNGA